MELKRKTKKAQTAPAFCPTGSVCKICLEDDMSSTVLSPCRCIGSVKYVHEDCLKTWILAKRRDIRTSSCEICNTHYLMDVKIGKRCIYWQFIRSNVSRGMVGPMLILALFMVFLMIYVLVEKIYEASNSTAKVFPFIMIAICGVVSIALSALIFLFFRQFCYAKVLKEWNILDFPIVEKSCVQDEITLLGKSRVENYVEPNELVIPPMSCVNGTMVITPSIAPGHFHRNRVDEDLVVRTGSENSRERHLYHVAENRSDIVLPYVELRYSL